MIVRSVVAAALVLACGTALSAQVPSARPAAAEVAPSGYQLPVPIAPTVPRFTPARDGFLYASLPGALFAVRPGATAREIGRSLHADAQSIGGDGNLWSLDAGTVTRIDAAGMVHAIALAAPALAIAADGVHTDVLEANAIESFDAAGVAHRIPLGRSVSHATLAALPNEILIADEDRSGLIRVDRDDRVEVLKFEGDLHPGSLQVVGNTAWFVLRSGAAPTRRLGRVHDRIIQTVDFATFAPILRIAAGAPDRFIVVESFDVYGVIGIAGTLACERSIGTGFPGSLIAQMWIAADDATYVTTSRVPGFSRITDACR